MVWMNLCTNKFFHLLAFEFNELVLFSWFTENFTDRCNMRTFLAKDIERKFPIGYEEDFLNIFDPDEIAIANCMSPQKPFKKKAMLSQSTATGASIASSTPFKSSVYDRQQKSLTRYDHAVPLSIISKECHIGKGDIICSKFSSISDQISIDNIRKGKSDGVGENEEISEGSTNLPKKINEGTGQKADSKLVLKNDKDYMVGVPTCETNTKEFWERVSPTKSERSTMTMDSTGDAKDDLFTTSKAGTEEKVSPVDITQISIEKKIERDFLTISVPDFTISHTPGSSSSMLARTQAVLPEKKYMNMKKKDRKLENDDMVTNKNTCLWKSCKRKKRIDSRFCSDGCGVRTLESDLLLSIKYAEGIHPGYL
mmetsp:Transcript_17523/g.39592  ORF Transcript_17523/g.39592 Transcript_17523/m.39592 type:complete len:368 (+) Transcript_17523:2897-4000(+)